MIAALYVETGGVYYGLPDVDPWDEKRDAMRYAGPWPVVAHPPCPRWCRLAGAASQAAAERQPALRPLDLSVLIPLESLRLMHDRESRLLLELARAHAPGSLLTAEGFTRREIAGARADVSLETTRPGNSGPAAAPATWTPASGDRGARGSDHATTFGLEGSRTRGRGALDARGPARAAHSATTRGAASV